MSAGAGQLIAIVAVIIAVGVLGNVFQDLSYGVLDALGVFGR